MTRPSCLGPCRQKQVLIAAVAAVLFCSAVTTLRLAISSEKAIGQIVVTCPARPVMSSLPVTDPPEVEARDIIASCGCRSRLAFASLLSSGGHELDLLENLVGSIHNFQPGCAIFVFRDSRSNLSEADLTRVGGWKQVELQPLAVKSAVSAGKLRTAVAAAALAHLNAAAQAVRNCTDGVVFLDAAVELRRANLDLVVERIRNTGTFRLLDPASKECVAEVAGYSAGSQGESWLLKDGLPATCRSAIGTDACWQQLAAAPELQLTDCLPAVPSREPWFHVRRDKSAQGTPYRRFIRKRSAFSVIVPLSDVQYNATLRMVALLWRTVPPCYKSDFDWSGQPGAGLQPPELVFFVSGAFSQEQTNRLPEALQSPQLQHCFRSIRFHNAKLSGDADVYYAGAPTMWRMVVFADPWFEEMRRTTDYFMFLEPDVTVVRSSWLLELHRETALDLNPFWAKAGQWIGDVDQEPPVFTKRMHMNGNGLWSFHSEFGDFAKRVQKGNWDAGGWDVELFEHMWQIQSEMRHYWHLFRYTKMIVNGNGVPWKPQEVLEYLPDTYFVHGKFRQDDGRTPLVFATKGPPYYPWDKAWPIAAEPGDSSLVDDTGTKPFVDPPRRLIPKPRPRVVDSGIQDKSKLPCGDLQVRLDHEEMRRYLAEARGHKLDPPTSGTSLRVHLPCHQDVADEVRTELEQQYAVKDFVACPGPRGTPGLIPEDITIVGSCEAWNRISKAKMLSKWAKRITYVAPRGQLTKGVVPLIAGPSPNIAGCWTPGMRFAVLLEPLLKAKPDGFRSSSSGSGKAGGKPTVLDIGAGNGGVSLLAAALGFPTIAAEALPYNARRLAVTVAANGLQDSLFVVPAAVSNVQEMVPIMTNGFNGQITNPGMPTADEVTHIPTTTLDSVVAMEHLEDREIIFAMIDCVGYEGRVIRGATQVLEKKQISVITMAFSPGNLRTLTHVNPWEVLWTLDDAGFDVFLLDLMHDNDYLRKHWRDPAPARFTRAHTVNAFLSHIGVLSGGGDAALLRTMHIARADMKAFSETAEDPNQNPQQQAMLVAVHRSIVQLPGAPGQAASPVVDSESPAVPDTQAHQSAASRTSSAKAPATLPPLTGATLRTTEPLFAVLLAAMMAAALLLTA